EEKDYAAQNMLKWFIDEQVEEEESAQEIIDQLDAVEGNKYGLLMIDKDLATRTYTVPSPLNKGE
ncbi:MAG: ferritin, partial [Bacteroidales bacterium]|nr:ferritin [Bacteroidales bacterium]